MGLLSIQESDVRIEVTTNLHSVHISELSLGGEYPLPYKIVEYFPSLANPFLKRMMTSTSVMHCKLNKTLTDRNSTLQFSLSDCTFKINEKPKLSALTQAYVNQVCSPPNGCDLMSSPFGLGKTADQNQSQKPVQNLPQNPTENYGHALGPWTLSESLSASLADVHKVTAPLSVPQDRREFFFAQKNFLRHIAPLSSLLSPVGHNQENAFAFLLVGGALPEQSSAGRPVEIKLTLQNKPIYLQKGKIDGFCLEPGVSEISFQNVILKARIKKNAFFLEGDFVFSHKVKVEVTQLAL